ncbi:MAG: ROK family protein [Dongiaceae bacterium]
MGANPIRYVLGIDVGGTKIAAGSVDPRTGAILDRETIPTGAVRPGSAILDDVVALARRLAQAARGKDRPMGQIGIGVPQLVGNDGRIRSAHGFDWTILPVRERLSAIAPATIESDVRAAALAEARLGAGRGLPVFAYVTIGTGVSYCLVIDGRPQAGANGFAIHFASSALHVNCRVCGAINRPVIEQIAAGPALIENYRRRTGRAVAGARDILAAAATGDPAAADVVISAADHLGALVGQMVNMLDPAAIILGGGLGLATGLYRDRLIATARAHIWAEPCRDLPILPAALSADAGLIGAALSAQ